MQNAKIVRYLQWRINGRIHVDVIEKTGTKNGVTYYLVKKKEKMFQTNEAIT